MRSLIGRNFPLADRLYRIVDVRQVPGDTLVYAVPVIGDESGVATLAPRAARAAFHYSDIARHLPVEACL